MERARFLRQWALGVAVLGTAVLSGSPAGAQQSALQAQAATPADGLIPLKEFLAPRRGPFGHRISPDGKRMFWLDRSERRVQLHVRDLDGGGPERVIQLRRGARWYRWTADSRRIIFLRRDRSGRENHSLFVADPYTHGKKARILTPFRGVKVFLLQILEDRPGAILIGMNRRDRSVFDVHRVDLESGALTLVERNPGDVTGYVADRAGNIVARTRRTKDENFAFEVRRGDAWRTLFRPAYDEPFRWIPVPPAGTGELLVFSHRSGDKQALARLDLATGKETVLYRHPRVDVARVWIDPVSYRPLMAAAQDGHWHHHFFDSALERDLKPFFAAAPVSLGVTSMSRDKSRMVVRVRSDRAGTALWLLDRRTGRRERLSEGRMARHADRLRPMMPITFKARDGLLIHGDLTVPAGRGKNLPLVLNVHGGPWVQDHWGYDRRVQWFANRGYAVLRIDYRGSSGYGLAFRRALIHQYARKAHDDLIDGVRWAIARGIADPKRVAIFGRSYGGYAAFVGMTMTPDVFRAGVAIAGMSDLLLQGRRTPNYWKLYNRKWREYQGDPRDPKDRAEMEARSPINFVDRIRAPMLVAHGGNDIRVARAHSDGMVAAMRARNLAVEYLLFEHEGHHIGRPKNRMRLERAIERFLAANLGGAAEAASP